MEGMSIVMAVGGLLVTLVMVAGSIWFVMRLMGGMNREAKERDRLLREGIQASARLMAVQMGGMTVTVGVHRHLQLQLQLEVTLQGRPPYPAHLTTMVSELQIPQLQPGAMLTVRVDRNDPMKIALEGAGAPAPQAYGGPPQQGGFAPPPPPPGGFGAPMGAFGAPPAYGAQQPYGGPQAYGGGMTPFGASPVVPAGAKIGLWIGVGGAVVGVLVAVIVVAVNVGGVGLGSASEGDSVCAQAVRCCEVVTAGNASAANCKNMGKLGVPSQVCESTLESMKASAKAQGKTCH